LTEAQITALLVIRERWRATYSSFVLEKSRDGIILFRRHLAEEPSAIDWPCWRSSRSSAAMPALPRRPIRPLPKCRQSHRLRRVELRVLEGG
jgi:hypothetical protein